MFKNGKLKKSTPSQLKCKKAYDDTWKTYETKKRIRENHCKELLTRGLNHNGFLESENDLESEFDLLRLDKIQNILRLIIRPMKCIQYKQSSYGMKRDIELILKYFYKINGIVETSEENYYISNGEFIKACIDLGY